MAPTNLRWSESSTSSTGRTKTLSLTRKSSWSLKNSKNDRLKNLPSELAGKRGIEMATVAALAVVAAAVTVVIAVVVAVIVAAAHQQESARGRCPGRGKPRPKS